MSKDDGKASSGRFRKGKSGNPGGRPKKPKPRQSAFDVIVDRRLLMTSSGQSREVTIEEALQQRVYQNAIAGQRLAQRQVIKWIQKREAWYALHAVKRASRIVSMKYSPDPDNANDALQILGIASRDRSLEEGDPDTVRLKLEPWAVKAALARRRGATPLSKRDVDDIRRCVRDPDSLKFPRGTLS